VTDFHATSPISRSGWIAEHDTEPRAKIIVQNDVLRIEDARNDGQRENGRFRFDLPETQRATASRNGFGHQLLPTGILAFQLCLTLCLIASEPLCSFRHRSCVLSVTPI